MLRLTARGGLLAKNVRGRIYIYIYIYGIGAKTPLQHVGDLVPAQGLCRALSYVLVSVEIVTDRLCRYDAAGAAGGLTLCLGAIFPHVRKWPVRVTVVASLRENGVENNLEWDGVETVPWCFARTV